MKRRRDLPPVPWLLLAGLLGFASGVILMAAISAGLFAGEAVRADAAPAPEKITVRPTLKESPPAVEKPPARVAAPAVGMDAVEDRRQQHLTLPVRGINRDELRSSFDEKRGGTRRHEALDVLAPRNTPVLAVEDGKIARLFLSEAGGITIYQFDPTENYVYYYAHLERYAEGLKEGASVERGDVIGYVGTTGNAPRDTPHLHFAIFKMTPEKKWWQGTPIDPYLVFK